MWLLRYEGAVDGSGSDAIVVAADRVLRRMQTDLTRWFGSEGSRALLLRALDRTRSGYPALASVDVSLDVEGAGPPPLDGLLDSLRSGSPSETMDAFVALITAVIALLGRLVGDDMVLRLMAESWPDALRWEPRLTDEGTRE